MSEPDATTQRRPREALDPAGIVAILLAPLRLPERIFDALGQGADALDELVQSLQSLPAIRAELIRIRESTETLTQRVATLDRINDNISSRLDAVLIVLKALEDERSHLNRSVHGLYEKLDALHDDLAPVDDRLITIEHAVKELAAETSTIRGGVLEAKDNIESITGSKGERGPLERVRDKVTGGDSAART